MIPLSAYVGVIIIQEANMKYLILLYVAFYIFQLSLIACQFKAILFSDVY